MKGKNVFFALGLSLVMGLGAVAALGANKNVDKAEAWGSSSYDHIYVVGGFTESNGSFLEMTKPSADADYERIVEMKEGDWFKFTNSADWSHIVVARNWDGITKQSNTCWTDLTTDGGAPDNNFIINADGKYRVYMERDALEGSWGEAEYGIHIEEYVEKQDPSAETNTFYVYDGSGKLGNTFTDVKVYGFGQDSSTKAMEWPGTHDGLSEVTLGELNVYKVELSTSYPKFIMTGNSRQTVDVEDFASHHDDLLVLGSETEGKLSVSWMEASDFTDYPAEVGYYISGLDGDWTYAGSEKMNNTDQGGNVAFKMSLEVTANTEIRVRSYYKDRFPYTTWATAGNEDLYDGLTKLGEKSGDNFKFLVAGNYDVYAKYEGEPAVFKFYVAKAAVTYDVTIYAELFRGKDFVQEVEVGTYLAYSNEAFEYTPAARSGYGIRGIFEDQACTETPYSPKILAADTDLFVRYNLLGYYMFGDAGAGVTWTIDGGSYLTTDVQDTDNNLLEGTITITGASVAEPVSVRPGEYDGGDEINWELSYTMGATYEFAYKEGNNIKFKQNGTFAIYVNKEYKVYLNAGADAFYTKFLTEVSLICDDQGKTNVTNLKSTWSAQEIAYNSLSVDEKNAIKALGFADVGEEDDLHKVVTKYHYIVVKYYSQGINDFIWNTYSGSNTVRFASINSNSAIIAIVAIGAVATASLVGLFFVIRRRKEVK